MKKLIIVWVGLIVAGCATTSRQDEANAKIDNLEKRVARIEGDLYKVEATTTGSATTTFAPAKEVVNNVVNAKIDAFLKEYLGVQFGDSFDNFPEKVFTPSQRDIRRIPVLKEYKYLNRAEGRFYNGKLCEVQFFVDIDKKYSKKSINEKIEPMFADLAVTLGVESMALVSEPRGFFKRQIPSNGYAFGRLIEYAHVTGAYRHGVEFSNQQLEWQLIEEERRIKDAVGETLPALDEFLEAENRRAAEREQLRKELQKELQRTRGTK